MKMSKFLYETYNMSFREISRNDVVNAQLEAQKAAKKAQDLYNAYLVK